MNRLRGVLNLIAPIAALFLVIAGVMLLRLHYWTAGIASLLVAMAVLIADVRFPHKFATGPEDVQTFRLAWRPAALWLTVVWLNGVAVMHVIGGTAGGDPRLASAAWLGSVLIGLLIVWLTPSQPGRFRRVVDRIVANRGELALLVAIVLVAVIVRTYALSTHPYPWSGDEVSVAREASRIVSGETTRLFQTGWSDQPNWSFVPTATMQFFLGNGIFPTRLMSALLGVAAVIAVYLVARELFDGVVAVLSAAFLATLPYHVHFSRLGFHNILDSLSSSVLVWLAVKAVKTRDPRYYYTAGAAAGLALYSYPGTRLAMVLAAVTLVSFLSRERAADARRGLHALVFLAGALVSAAPQAVFFALNPARFLSRLGQEGILLNGWLWQHAAETGVSTVRVLFDQFTGTVLTFIAQPAPGNLFNSPYPYLTLPESLLFLVGMVSALAWMWTPRHFILLGWFWIVVVLGGVLTMNPPANTRLLMTTPAVAMLMAIGLRTIFGQLRQRGLVRAATFGPACAVVVALVATQNIQFYLGEYRTRAYFQDANSEFAMEVGLMARELRDDADVYLLGAPRVFASFPTLRYLAPRNRILDVTAGDLDGLELAAGQRAAFFAIPENHTLLADLQRKYPGGSGGVIHRKNRPDQILFAYYLVTPAGVSR